MRLARIYKSWKIYEEASEGYTTYYAFLPGCSPRNFDSPEWEDDTMQCLIEFIDSYDFSEED